MSKRIVVLGATGNTGRPLAEHLLEKEHTVVAVGRDAAKLADLKAKGAEIAIGDLQDTAFLAKTFTGADAAYVLIPPNMAVEDFSGYQDAVGQSIAEALQTSRVSNAVHLSSQGADVPSGNGPVAALFRQEARLNAIDGLSVVHLRPAYFLENLFMFLGQLPGGTIYSHLQPDASTPMIATQDIAAAAASWFDKLPFSSNRVVDLLGADAYSFADVLHALREAFQKPALAWQVIPDKAQLEGMLGFGMKQQLAEQYIELGQAINNGFFENRTVRTTDNTTPTTLHTFVKQVLVPAASQQG